MRSHLCLSSVIQRVNSSPRATGTRACCQRMCPTSSGMGKRFQKRSPELPRSVEVEVTMMPGVHATFGWVPKKPVSPHAYLILAFMDTRAQTCSAGPEIKKLLRYPDGYLVSTTHRIQGITRYTSRVSYFYV